jgi:hypothetical protein
VYLGDSTIIYFPVFDEWVLNLAAPADTTFSSKWAVEGSKISVRVDRGCALRAYRASILFRHKLIYQHRMQFRLHDIAGGVCGRQVLVVAVRSKPRLRRVLTRYVNKIGRRRRHQTRQQRGHAQVIQDQSLHDWASFHNRQKYRTPHWQWKNYPEGCGPAARACTARIFRIAGKWDGAGASWYGI